MELEAATQIDGWLAELELTPTERVERDGATAWDIVLDGRRRRQLRMTLIHDPSVGLVCWAQMAPQLSDGFRKTYRQLLRWNDELPFAKFAISEDDRPILSLETAASEPVTRDSLGLLIAKSLAITDLLHDQAVTLMGDLRRRQFDIARESDPDPAGVRLLDRYHEELVEFRSGEAVPSR